VKIFDVANFSPFGIRAVFEDLEIPYSIISTEVMPS